MQVIGLCRFSYPAEGGFQVEHQTIEERSAYLYAPARIEERFRHFETVSLPGIRAQTDGDFTFAIVVGDNLPELHLERLNALISDVPQAVIIPWAPGERHRPVMRKILNQLRKDGQPCLQFRHDDDDAINVRFVQELRQTALDCSDMLARHPLVAFDFNNGYIASADSNGIAAEEVFNPFWGVALGMYVSAGENRSIFNFSHYKIPSVMPTISRPDPDMFVRGHNDYNDSRQKKNVTKVNLKPLDAAGEARFRDAFAIDADHVRRVFA